MLLSTAGIVQRPATGPDPATEGVVEDETGYIERKKKREKDKQTDRQRQRERETETQREEGEEEERRVKVVGVRGVM